MEAMERSRFVAVSSCSPSALLVMAAEEMPTAGTPASHTLSGGVENKVVVGYCGHRDQITIRPDQIDDRVVVR